MPEHRLNRGIVKLVGSFILSYPIAAVLKRLPDNSPEIKNAFIVGYDPPPLDSRFLFCP